MHSRLWWLLCCVVLLAGCASQPVAPSDVPEPAYWQGRVAVKVYSQPVQAWSAAFTLTGTPEQGSLRLTSPLGSVMAYLQWTPNSASLVTAEGVEQFDTLQNMVLRATGLDLPVSALFAWLQGQPVEVAGWEVTLPQSAQRRLVARQFGQAPEAELKMVLE